MWDDVPWWGLAWPAGMTLATGSFSAATACFSLRDEERRLRFRSRPTLRWVYALMREYETLTVVLQTGGLMGVGMASYAAFEWGRWAVEGATGIFAGATGAVISAMTGAAALPRLLGGYFPLQTLRFFAPLIVLMYGSLLPVALWMRPWVRRLYLPFLPSDNDVRPAPNPQEKMLKALIGLEEIPVKAVMRSRVEINAIAYHAGADELVAAFDRTGNSRLVVYDKTLDEVKGVAYAKDFIPLLEQPGEWQSAIRPPFFVPEYVKLSKLLKEFRARKLHFAIVVDEFGGTAGIVTLEDVLEEIFGEINDEYDKSVGGYSQLSKNEFVFSGRTSLMDVCRYAHLPEDAFDEFKGENETLAGLILELNGGFPRKGQTIVKNGFSFTVEAMTQTAVTRIKMKIERP
jgi:CBS domain containing-hemolysin-like protein